MTIRTRIGSDGRLTLPAELRRRLGWQAGTEVELRETGGRLVVHPSHRGLDPQGRDAGDDDLSLREFLERHAGSATSGLSTDEIMSMTRGED